MRDDHQRHDAVNAPASDAQRLAADDLIEITDAKELLRVLNANPGAGDAFWKGLVVNLLDRLHTQTDIMENMLDLLQRGITSNEQMLSNDVAFVSAFDEPVISPTAMAALLGVSTSTIDRMRKRGDLPEPVQTSERGRGYTLRQVYQARAAGLCRTPKNAKTPSPLDRFA